MVYEVGKGKPPVSGQFQKGQSGNPNGTSKHFKIPLLKQDTILRSEPSSNPDIFTLIREAINFALTSSVTELEKACKDYMKMPVYKVLIYKSVLRASKKGDIKFTKFLFKQVVGKV